jgi:hypothetical protein
LAAYNAKAVGVHHYIAQYMLNTPLGTSPKMDLAKMMAKIELIESLHDYQFNSVRQVRPGLFSYPPDPDLGKGQLAASINTGMMLEPHIVHVVGFCEADHAAWAEEVIESCKIAQRVIHDSLLGSLSPLQDREVKERKENLVQEAKIFVHAIASLGLDKNRDPLTDPAVYCQAIRIGLLDAPHLRASPVAKGDIKTRLVDGACLAIDQDTDEPIDEIARLERLGLGLISTSTRA